MSFESRLELVIDSRSGEQRLRSLEGQLDKVEGAGDRAAKGMGALKAAFGLAAAAAGGFSASRAVNEIASFEQSLLQLRVVSGATTTQMAELETQSRKLGATSVFSAKQAADAQNYLAMAGFSVNEVLSATPGLLELAAAGSMDLASAADLASNVLGGLSLGVEELGRVNDVLAAAAQGSNTSIMQLGQALSYAAPIASTAGLTIEETAAAIGVLSDAGLQASRAGTGLLGFIRQLSNVTPQAAASLSSYGLSVSDVNIEQNGLIDVLEKLQGASINTSDSFKIFGSEAGVAANILASGAVRVNEFTGQLELSEGAARRAALILGSGLEGSMKSFGSAISEATLQLGRDGGLSSGLQDLIDYATGVVSVYNGMLPIFQEANDLTDEQAGSLNKTATALSLTAGAVGGLTAAYISLTAATWAAGVAQTALLRLLRVNPIILAAGALVSLGSALYTARNRTLELGDTTADVGDWVLGTWQEVTTRVEDYWGETVDNVIEWLDEMGVDADSVADGIEDAFVTALDVVLGAHRTLFNTAVGIWYAQQTVVMGVADAITTAFNAVGANARTVFNALWKDIQAMLTLDFSTSHFTDALENELISVAAAVGNSAAETAGRAAEQLTDDHLGRIVGNAKAYFDDLGTSIENRVATNKQIESLTGLSRRLLTLGGGAKDTGDTVVVLGERLDETGDSVDRLTDSTKKATEAERERQRVLDDSISAYADLFKQLSPAGAATAEYNTTVARLTVAYEDGTKSALEYYAAIGQAAKIYNDAVKAADPNIKRVEQLSQQYDRAYNRGQQLATAIDDINAAYRRGDVSGEQYTRMIGNVRNEMQQLALESDPLAQEMARAWEEATNRIDETFSDAFAGAFDSFDSFADQLLDGFKRLLAELAYQATLKPIVVAFTGDMRGMMSGGGLNFGNTISAARGVIQGSSLFGGPSTAVAAGGLYSGASTGLSAGGLYGNAVTGGIAQTGIMSSISSGVSAAMPWIGAGILADNVLGLGIVEGITKALGSLFGSKKTFDFDFQQGGNFGVFGDRESAFGQSGITNFSDFKLDQQPELDAMLNGIVQLDNALAAAAIPERFEAMKASIEGFTHSGPEGLVESRLRAMIQGSGSLAADALLQIADPQAMAAAFLQVVELENIGTRLGGQIVNDIADEIERTGNVSEAASQMARAAQTASLLADSTQRLNLQFDVTASGAIHAASALTEMVGGVESLANLQSSYYQSFFSDAERAANLQDDLTASLSAMGLALPDTRDGFRALVEAQDLHTESGQRNYATLLQLSGSFDQLRSAMSGMETATESVVETVIDATAEMMGLSVNRLDQAFAQLSRSVAAEQQILQQAHQATTASIQSNMRTIEEAMRSTEQVASSLRSSLNGMLAQNMPQSVTRQSGQAALREMLASGVSSQADLERALSAVSEPSEGLFSTFEDYQRDFLSTAHVIDALAEQAEGQLTIEQQSLRALERQLESAERQYQRESSMLDQTLETQRAQLEAEFGQLGWLESINGGIASIPEAIAALASAIADTSGRMTSSARNVAKGLDAGGSSLITGGNDPISQAYRDILGRDPDATGLSYFGASGGTEAQIREALKASQEYQRYQYSGIPGFATGGIATGPTSGYPVELHGTEAIIPLNGGNIPLNVPGIQALVREVQDLKRSLVDLNTRISENTLRTKQILEEQQFQQEEMAE